jgi:hypothetical protein
MLFFALIPPVAAEFRRMELQRRSTTQVRPFVEDHCLFL